MANFYLLPVKCYTDNQVQKLKHNLLEKVRAETITQYE